MRDVWVYAASRDSAGPVCSGLAELGFSARYLGPGDVLVPRARDGAPLGRPLLSVVVFGSDGAPAADLVGRLGASEQHLGAGILLSVPGEHLGPCATVTAADELILEPFSLMELETRVSRATRGGAPAESSTVIRAGSLELNPSTYTVSIAGDPVGFRYMEFELLRFLMTHPNRVFTREALLQRVWGYDYYGGARTVDVHIRRVRAKLGHEHDHRVKTVRSVGYLFELTPLRATPTPLRSVI